MMCHIQTLTKKTAGQTFFDKLRTKYRSLFSWVSGVIKTHFGSRKSQQFLRFINH